MINTIKQLFRRKRRLTDEEVYYHQSVDLADLERRMRLVQTGLAPYQIGYLHWR